MRTAREPRSLRRLAGNPWLVAASILAGITLGKLAPGAAVRLAILGDIYISLLKMVVLPFMVAAVIFSVRKLFADRASAQVLPRVLAAFLAAFALSALAGLLAALVIAPGRHLSERTLLVMGRLAGSVERTGSHQSLALFGQEAAVPRQGLGELAKALIPSNIFAALTEGETLKVLAFSLLFGLAVGRTPERIAESLVRALETVYRACMELTQWFNLMLPVVLFAIVANQTARTGLEPLQAMLKFLLALGLGTLILVGASLWVLRLASGRPWAEVLRSQRDPLLMAIATRSSNACMPAMIAGLADNLGFARSRVELLVPLGISLLRIGPVLYYVVATVFTAQLYGVPLGAGQLVLVAVAAMLAGFASSGMTGLVTISLTGLVCTYLHLPFEAVLALSRPSTPCATRCAPWSWWPATPPSPRRPPARRGSRLCSGVLGGMGPAATADFLAKLVALTPALRDQEHIPVLVSCRPQVPDPLGGHPGCGPVAPAGSAGAAGPAGGLGRRGGGHSLQQQPPLVRPVAGGQPGADPAYRRRGGGGPGRPGPDRRPGGGAGHPRGAAVGLPPAPAGPRPATLGPVPTACSRRRWRRSSRRSRPGTRSGPRPAWTRSGRAWPRPAPERRSWPARKLPLAAARVPAPPFPAIDTTLELARAAVAFALAAGWNRS